MPCCSNLPPLRTPFPLAALWVKFQLLPKLHQPRGLWLLPGSLHPGLLSPWLAVLHYPAHQSARHRSRVHACLGAFARAPPGTFPQLLPWLLLLMIRFQLTRAFLKEAFSACLFLSTPPPYFFPDQPHLLRARRIYTWAAILTLSPPCSGTVDGFPDLTGLWLPHLSQAGDIPTSPGYCEGRTQSRGMALPQRLSLLPTSWCAPTPHLRLMLKFAL